jgi:hypothetical protein
LLKGLEGGGGGGTVVHVQGKCTSDGRAVNRSFWRDSCSDPDRKERSTVYRQAEAELINLQFFESESSQT